MSGLAFVIAVIAAVLAVVFWFQSQSAAQAVAGLKAEADAAKKEAEAARAQAREGAAELKARGTQLLEAREKLAEARKKSHDAKGKSQQPRGAREAELEEDLVHARNLTAEALASAGAGRREVAAAKAEAEKARAELARAQEKLRELSSRPPVASGAAPQAAPAQGNPGLEAAVKDLQAERAELKKQVEAAEAAVDSAKKRELGARDELRRARGRAETNNRVYMVTKGELEVIKERLAQAERRLWQAGITLPVPAPKERPKATGPAAADRVAEASAAAAQQAQVSPGESAEAPAAAPVAQELAQVKEGEPIAQGQAESAEQAEVVEPAETTDASLRPVAPLRRRPGQGEGEPKQG